MSECIPLDWGLVLMGMSAIAGAIATRGLIAFGARLRGPVTTTRPHITLTARPLPFVETDGVVPMDGSQTGRVYLPWPPGGIPTAAASKIEFRLSTLEGIKSVLVTKRELQRFLEMEQPTRKYWTGDKSRFTELRSLALSLGWCKEVDGRGGCAWCIGYTSLGRRVRELRERNGVEF